MCDRLGWPLPCSSCSQLLHPLVSAGCQQIPSWRTADGSETELCHMWWEALCTRALKQLGIWQCVVVPVNLTPSRPMIPLTSLYPGTFGNRVFSSQSGGSPCAETRFSNFTAHFMEFPLSLGEGVQKFAGILSKQGLQDWASVNKSCNVFAHAGNREKVSSGFLSIWSYQGGKSGLWSFVNKAQSWRQLPPPSSAMQSSGSHKTFMKPVINRADKEQDIRFQESAASWGTPSL